MSKSAIKPKKALFMGFFSGAETSTAVFKKVLSEGPEIGDGVSISVSTPVSISINSLVVSYDTLTLDTVNIKMYRVVIIRNHVTSLRNDIISIINNSTD